MSVDRLDLAVENPARLAEPRVAGDLCYSGYWQEFYLVLKVGREGTHGSTWITCLWLGKKNRNTDTWIEGTENLTTHMTMWDWNRDKFAEFNLLACREEGGYADYDEFMAVMRDCADFAILS